jgi:diguanylate cyclase (GGDEF)-like protein
MTACDVSIPIATPASDAAGPQDALHQQLRMEQLRRQVFESVAREELLDHTLRCLTSMLERESPRLRACVAYEASAGEPICTVAGRGGDAISVFGRASANWPVRFTEPAPADGVRQPRQLCCQHADSPDIITAVGAFPDVSAGWAMALGSGGNDAAPPGVVAVLVAGDPTPTPAERSLIELAADLAGFAVGRRRQADQAARRLMHDALTDLPNATLLEDRLTQAMEVCRRQESRIAVIMLDLDGLRLINESLGRQSGDAVLRTLAERIQTGLRRSDTVARTGGDKFTVMAAINAGRRDAATLARKVTQLLSSPVAVAGREVSLSVNAGVSLFPGDADTAGTLVHAAEVALHRAKREGRNAIHFFKASEHDTALADLELEGHFRRSVEVARERQAGGVTTVTPAAGGLELHYQPQVSPSGVIVGVEALARWTHPLLGRVPPDRFIAAAEQSGLIIPFGEWALREALTQARRWRERFGPLGPRVAVNVSAIQFATPRFVDTVERLLNESNVEPGRIELELTETVLMRDADETGRKVSQLRSMGLSVAIDDFGTGYSSLAYLHRLTIDTLKVDRSFVSALASPDRRPPGGPAMTPGNGAAVTRAIVSMGRSLGMTILAEGVETETQRALLERMGCDVMQGYLFSPPVPADRIDQMLKSGGVLPVAAPAAIPA